MKPIVLVIVGPTASGKSDLAIQLAKKLRGEVISADSRQVYKGLNIGAGKITKKEMQGVPHHLLDVVSPKTRFTAAEYAKKARSAITMIYHSGKLPIIVGGTGFYIDALTMELPEVSPNLKLRKKLEKKSLKELQRMLGKHGVKDPKNKVRLIRALEIIEALGKIPKPKVRDDYEFIWIGLKPKDLDKRIENRLKKRLPGMIREARELHAKGLSWKRMEEMGLEYRYLSRYLKREMTKGQMTDELLKEIRHYSKRQMTWFKRNKATVWFDSPSRALRATTAKLEARQKQSR